MSNFIGLIWLYSLYYAQFACQKLVNGTRTIRGRSHGGRNTPQGGTTLRWVYTQKLRSEWPANVEAVREGIKNGER